MGWDGGVGWAVGCVGWLSWFGGGVGWVGQQESRLGSFAAG